MVIIVITVARMVNVWLTMIVEVGVVQAFLRFTSLMSTGMLADLSCRTRVLISRSVGISSLMLFSNFATVNRCFIVVEGSFTIDSLVEDIAHPRLIFAMAIPLIVRVECTSSFGHCTEMEVSFGKIRRY